MKRPSLSRRTLQGCYLSSFVLTLVLALLTLTHRVEGRIGTSALLASFSFSLMLMALDFRLYESEPASEWMRRPVFRTSEAAVRSNVRVMMVVGVAGAVLLAALSLYVLTGADFVVGATPSVPK